MLLNAQSILFAKNDKDDNVPEGFKKFLKKTRRSSSSETKAADQKDEKKAQHDGKKKEEEEDEFSELEEETETDTKKDSEKKEQSEGAKKLKEFFYQPNGKDPKWENIAILAFLTGAFGYYLATMKPPSEEITYPEFINTYLAQHKCSMITISEDKSSDTFKFRAVINTKDGKTVHMVLP